MSFRNNKTSINKNNNNNMFFSSNDNNNDTLSFNHANYVKEEMNEEELQLFKKNLKDKTIETTLTNNPWSNPYSLSMNKFNTFQNNKQLNEMKYNKLNDYKNEFNQSPYHRFDDNDININSNIVKSKTYNNNSINNNKISNSNNNINNDNFIKFHSMKKTNYIRSPNKNNITNSSNNKDTESNINNFANHILINSNNNSNIIHSNSNNINDNNNNNQLDLLATNFEISNRNLYDSYSENQNQSFSSELSSQGISILVFLLSLCLSSLNLAMYRQFVYIYDDHRNKDLFFLYKELLVFFWRTQLVFLFFIVYLSVIKIIENIYIDKYGEEYVYESEFFQLHYFNSSFSFSSINNVMYSCFNSSISFLLFLSTAFMPVSLTVLISNSDTFFNFVMFGKTDEDLNLDTSYNNLDDEEKDKANNNIRKLSNTNDNCDSNNYNNKQVLLHANTIPVNNNINMKLNNIHDNINNTNTIFMSRTLPANLNINQNKPITTNTNTCTNTYSNIPNNNHINYNKNNFSSVDFKSTLEKSKKYSTSQANTYVTTVIKFFCVLIFIMGVSMLLSFKKDFIYYLGLSMPLLATLININYQKTYMEFFISEQKPFQIFFNMIIVSNIFLFCILVFAQIFYLKKTDVLSLFGWVYLGKKDLIDAVLVGLISGLAITFTILSSNYLSKNSCKLKKILEVPLTEVICVFGLSLYNFVQNSNYYFGIMNILIVITLTEFIEIFNWLKYTVKRKDN